MRAAAVEQTRWLEDRDKRTLIHNAMIALAAKPARRTVRMDRQDRLVAQGLLAHMAHWLSVGVEETCFYPGEFPEINTNAAVRALRTAARLIGELGTTDYHGPVSMSRQLNGVMQRWDELGTATAETDGRWSHAV